MKGRGWEAPRDARTFMETLGSQFVAHPPIEPYRVEVTQPSHPLVAGIEPFDASDELYLMELHPPFETLLHTRWHGEAKGFAERDWSKDEPRPVMYLKQVGAGEVLYFTLGHARGHYDMRPDDGRVPDGRARQLAGSGLQRTAAAQPALGRRPGLSGGSP